jgi:hypothetical protein|tara:strand:- start:976 stop:1134 length:159 start_codon:yes stop_codon:yes gene_type:complete
MRAQMDFARSVVMTEFMIAFGMGISFIVGFWVGVDWYRRKINGGIYEKEART